MKSLPLDYSRCYGRKTPEGVDAECVDCLRRNIPEKASWLSFFAPPPKGEPCAHRIVWEVE